MSYGDAEWHKKYQHPSYVNEGQKVIAPYKHKGKITGLRCIVTKACGNHCVVENAERGFSKWFDVMDLVIEKT